IKVPDQISLVSFDSVDLCAGLYPPVSAVHFPISEMARSAVQALITQITQQAKTRCCHFSGELKLRQADRAFL
ncbi:substrate-binding domain-containing protein, partial [Vibrio rotiferianus]